MASSPLRSKSANAVSVCGKILQRGQTITVVETAVGPRERKMAEGGRISIRASNEKGKVQIVCTIGG